MSFKWLLPLLAVIVLAWFGRQYLSNNNAEQAVTGVEDSTTSVAEQTIPQSATVSPEALQAARDAMPAGVDLSKITSSLEGMFGSTTEALAAITDVESATSALPRIKSATAPLSGLSEVISRLPDAARAPITAVIDTGIASLQPLVEKVTAIPGVAEIVHPVVGPTLEKLQSLVN